MSVNQNTSPWISKYPKGISAELNPEAYPSLVELMEEGFKKYSSQPAYTFMDKTITYAQVDKMSRDFAAYLQGLGLQKGDKIAIQMPNCSQYPIALYGALRAGLTVVNTNPLYTPREMKHQFTDSGAKAIVIVANFAFNLEKVATGSGYENKQCFIVKHVDYELVRAGIYHE